MISKGIGSLGLALGMALATSACVDDYGYSGVQVGYAGAYGDPYYDGYGYDGYGGYGAQSYYGWYGDYYYPGTGIYVYDQYRRPYRWSDTQQRYWSNQQRYRGRDWNGSGSWNGFDRRNQPDRGYDGYRQGQANPGNRQWQQQNRNGYAPGAGQWQQNRDGSAPGTGQWQQNRNGSAPGTGQWQQNRNGNGQWQQNRNGDGAGRGQWRQNRDSYTAPPQTSNPAPVTGNGAVSAAPQQGSRWADRRGRGRDGQ